MDFKTFITEEAEKTAVMAFGRYNPPTREGHGKVFDKVAEVAKRTGGTGHIIASHSENTAKDPLSQSKKIGYIKKMAPKGVNVSGSSREHPSIFHQASKLHAAGHNHLVVVAGSDRVDEYKTALNKYNGVKGKHGYYKFKKIDVESSGNRDADKEGAEGMSASKVRAHARAGNFKEFKSALHPSVHPHAKEMYDHIRSQKEDYENPYRFDDSTPEGTKYMKKMTPGQNEANRVRQDSDIKDRAGTQPAKYHSGLSTSTKAARDAQFKRQTKMDSRDPAAYKPAPGDDAKTKPSKYTTAYKKRFGEAKIPVLLLNLKKLMEEANQVSYDTIQTKHFDICPSAVEMFTKHINDANNGIVFMDLSTYMSKMEEAPIIKQRELVKAAIEATDSYLGVEKLAEQRQSATPTMIVDFNYFVKRASQALDLLGVLEDHNYIQSHVDRMIELSDYEVKMGDNLKPKADLKNKMFLAVESIQFDEEAEKGLAAKAEKSGMSLDTLKKVYRRGVAAWRTGHRPGTTPQQWGMARVNSYIMKGKGTYHGADKDLREESAVEISDDDISQMVDDLDWEDIVDLYSNGELVDDEDDEDDEDEDKNEIKEGLTAQGRIKKRQSFARFKGRRGIARSVKLRRASDMNTLQRRAKVAARNALYKRFLKGRDKSQLSASEKERIEQQVGRLKNIQSTLMQRMLPKIRSIEQKRLSRQRSQKR
jgi:hypothetical protein